MVDDQDRGAAGHDAQLAEIHRQFSQGLPARLEILRSALVELTEGYQQAMAESFYRAAHSLKGTAASFGTPDLAAHAALLADLGDGWVRRHAAPHDEISSASAELQRLEATMEAYTGRVEGGGAE